MQINPNSPPPNYENSTWVEDWTADLDTSSYIDSLAKSGVNTINVFCGQLDFQNGQYLIDGFSEDTPGRPAGTGAFINTAQLTDFVQKCKQQGIKVKLSIGGEAGTTFGNSWNKLSTTNISDYAKALNQFCNTTGAEGIDFDDELADTGVAALAGQLAGQLKDLNPNLDLSFCVFGGINAQGPTHPVDSVFLQNAKTSDGNCAINRIYVMSYYDGCTLSQNEEFMTQWASYLKDNFNMSPSQLSAGVDPNDPTTSYKNGSLAEWIQFAAKNGFSTAIWDQQGVDDYIKGNGQESWGSYILQLYNTPPDHDGLRG